MIEPSSLISRLMTFVMAGALTILIVLTAALSQMFPLERTQVFFLSSKPSSGQTISIEQFDMKPHNLDVFKDNFIKEYITVRNQIIPSNPVMRRKWRADPDGLVYAYSSIDVYSSFMKTDLWHAIMVGKYEPLTFRCDVSFDKIVPRKIDRESEKYAVMFRWICSDESTGQSTTKDFTIAIGLAFQTSLNRDERLDNPLGLKVVEYEPETGVDPLNWLQVVEYEPDAGGEPKAGGDPLNRPQEE